MSSYLVSCRAGIDSHALFRDAISFRLFGSPIALENTQINIKYALFTDTHGKWRVMAVPTSPSAFSSRKALPEEWCGLRDQELSEKAGIPGCIFVHASGFIGGNNTKVSAPVFLY